MELVPLKVLIGLTNKGFAGYPDFSQLATVKSSGLDWSIFVDSNGMGWIYDKKTGHKEVAVDSPMGQQNGVLLVTEEFATQAIAMFPDKCSVLKETEFETFYNEKATVHMPHETVDEKIVNGIAAKQTAGRELTATDNAALDPDDPTPGIKKNPNKVYADFKVKRGFTIKK